MRTANKVIYVVFGIFALLYAVAALFSPATVGGEAAQSFHLEHAMREQGAAGVFLALMFFWCVFN